MLSRQLIRLEPLPFTAQEQRHEAGIRADKMSIQGVQPKLSAVLKIKECRFEIVDRGGKFILKPQCEYEEIPQNEAVTMTMASIVGIDVPVHGLLYSKDGSFTYFVKRFDRTGKKNKVAVEDFAQLSGQSRETKYKGSMEMVAKILDQYCTFPLIEKVKLFRRTLFSYITGNEDMHLKNISLIRNEDKIELSPAYDLVNSTIALPAAREELALPLNGKKAELKRSDFVDYFAMKRLGLNADTTEDILEEFSAVAPRFKELISVSFLSQKMKEKYALLMEERLHIIFP
jgi:serine/threonine-protein kinase HipA